ncbi:MAG: ABC transporter ATP-binding protein [Pseudomonadota bacterium]
MGLMLNFFRAYPAQTVLMLLALLLSGIAEGIGLSALLPMVNIALGAEATATLGPFVPESDNAFEQAVLDALAKVGIAPTLGNMLLIMVGMLALKSAFLLAAQRQVGYTAAQVGTDLRLQMLRAVLKSKWEYFLHQPVGKLTNALATEAQRSSTAFVNGATAITFLIQAIVYGGVAFAISWRASLAAIGAGALVIILSHFLVRLTRKAGKRQTTLMATLMANLTDTLQSVKPVKAMAREHLADQVLALDTNRLNKALRRQVIYAAILDSAQELMFASFICLGVWVAVQKFSMDLALVLVLALALGRAFSFFGKVQKQYQKLAQGESAYWSIMASIEAATAAEEKLDGGSAASFDKQLRFHDVVFAYDAQHPVFNGLNLELRTGALTTLVGPSGSGKTTIIDLAIGLLQPDDGAVLLDGVPLSDIDIKAWRRLIGYVPQDTLLLHDTILHNVTLGDPALTEDHAKNALRAAGALDFVTALPEGLETVVGERGGKLSGGQRQRIVIARALINQPKLLILDEATSALDRESEEAVRQSMESLKGQLTILAISHNRALIQAADYVYEMNGSGAHLLDESSAAELTK